MSILESLASRPEPQKLALTLLHFLWQGGAIALLIASAVFTLHLQPGRQRYAAYLIALILMTACPIVTYCLTDAPPRMATPIITASPQLDGLSGTIEVDATPPPTPPRLHPPLDVHILLHRALPWTLAAWSLGVAGLSLRLFLGLLGVRRWKRSAQPLPAHLRALSASIASRLGLHNFTAVHFSPLVRDAVAVGFWRPMVLLPASMISGLTPDLLEAVIAHELAHIRRKDLWINFFQRLAETLLFYHPAVWWVSARIREEREMCCDDLAVSVTGKRLEYASALAQAAHWRTASTLALAMRGGGMRGGRLLTRVQRILGLSPRPRRSAWPAGLAALALVILITLLAALPRPATADDTATPKAVPDKPQPADETPAANPRLDADVEAALRQDVEFTDCLKQLAQANREIVALEARGLGDNHRDVIRAKRTARQIEEYLAQRRADMRVELDHRRNVAMNELVDRYVEEQADKDDLINALRQQLASTEVQRIVAEAQGSGPDAAAYQRLSTASKLLADRLAAREHEIRKLAEAKWRERQKLARNPTSFTAPAAGPTTPPAAQSNRRRADADSDLKESRIKLEIARVQITKRKALLEQAHAGGSVTETRIAEAELRQAELEAELIKLNLERAERGVN